MALYKKDVGKVKRKVILSVFFLMILFSFTACHHTDSFRKSVPEAETQFFAMNTYISLTAYGNEAEAALSDAEEQIRELEDLWSVTEEQSEIYRLNHHQENSMTVSTETADLISYALDMAEQTDGALEPTIYPVLCEWGFTTKEHKVPSAEEIERLLEYVGYEKVVLNGTEIEMPEGVQLDMGAVAKGYIGDLVIQQMKEQGISYAMLSLGGNMIAIKANINGSGLNSDDASGETEMSYTNPVLMKALLVSLVEEAGIPPEDITVYDVSRIFPDYMVEMCTQGNLSGIHFVGRINGIADESAPINWSYDVGGDTNYGGKLSP